MTSHGRSQLCASLLSAVSGHANQNSFMRRTRGDRRHPLDLCAPSTRVCFPLPVTSPVKSEATDCESAGAGAREHAAIDLRNPVRVWREACSVRLPNNAHCN